MFSKLQTRIFALFFFVVRKQELRCTAYVKKKLSCLQKGRVLQGGEGNEERREKMKGKRVK